MHLILIQNRNPDPPLSEMLYMYPPLQDNTLCHEQVRDS